MYKLNFKNSAAKKFTKLDRQVQKILQVFFNELIKEEDPKQKAKLLVGKFEGLFRYRVGDYRIICDINDIEITILILDIGHRKEVYK